MTSGVDNSRPHRSAPTQIDKALAFLGARSPTEDQAVAIKALCRGTATAGQQRRAMAYILSELCGVGRVYFAGEQTHSSSFRAGSQGVGITIAMIGDAVIMRFPSESEAQEDV